MRVFSHEDWKKHFESLQPIQEEGSIPVGTEVVGYNWHWTKVGPDQYRLRGGSEIHTFQEVQSTESEMPGDIRVWKD